MSVSLVDIILVVAPVIVVVVVFAVLYYLSRQRAPAEPRRAVSTRPKAAKKKAVHVETSPTDTSVRVGDETLEIPEAPEASNDEAVHELPPELEAIEVKDDAEIERAINELEGVTNQILKEKVAKGSTKVKKKAHIPGQPQSKKPQQPP